jgi:hypothetical protein
MPDVKLEILRQGPYIKAPDFCPYKESSTSAEFGFERHYIAPAVFQILPSICALCKYCTFIPDIENNFIQESPILDTEREVFIKYLVEFNSKIANDLLLQHKYLLSKNRTPIAIFISPSLFSQMLEFAGIQEKRRLTVYSIVFYKEQPVCTILGCPVYVSRKLSRTPAQVVGEIAWK